MAQADNLSLPEGLSIGLSMEGDGSTGLPTQFVKSMRTLFDMMDDSNSGKVALAEIERRWRDDAVPNLPGVLDALRTVAPANGLLTFEHFVSGLKLALHRVRSKNQPRRNVTANQQFGFQQISTNVQSMTWNGTHITDPNSCNTRSYLPAPPGHKVTANKRGSAYVRSNSSTNVDSDFSRRRARFKHRRSNSGPIVLGKSLSNMDQPSPLHGTMAFDDSVVEENRLQRMPRERDLHLGIGLSQKLPSCIPGRYEFSHRDRRNVKVLSDATNIGVRGSPSGCDSSSPDSAFYSPCQERSPSLHRNCCGGDPVSSKALLNDRISDDDGNTHVISVQPVVLSGKYIGITGTLKRTKSPAAIAQKRYGSLPRPTSKAMTNGGYSYSQLTENVATEEMHADQRMKSKDADSHPRKRSVPQRSESSLRSCVDYTHSERRTNVSPQAVPAEKSARKLAPALSIPRESKEPSKMRSFFSGDLNADTRRRKVSGSYHPSRRRNQRRNTTSISFDTSTMKQLTNIQQKEDLLRKGLATTEGIKKAILHALMQVENERSHLEAEMEAFTAGTRGFPNQPELQENSAVSPSVMTAMGSLEHIINDFLLLEMSTKHVTPNSSATVDSLADVQDENLRLSREVSEKSDVIRQLEEEKTALVRQLFQARSELQQREESKGDTSIFI